MSDNSIKDFIDTIPFSILGILKTKEVFIFEVSLHVRWYDEPNVRPCTLKIHLVSKNYTTTINENSRKHVNYSPAVQINRAKNRAK